MKSWRNSIASRLETRRSRHKPGSRAPPIDRNWSLRFGLLVVVSVALSPIATFSALQGLERARSDVTSIHERLTKSARSAASGEESVLASAEQVTRALSNLPAVRDGSPACDSELSEALFGVTNFSNLARLNKKGVVVCSAVATAKGVSSARQPIFQQVRRSSKFLVSGEIESADS